MRFFIASFVVVVSLAIVPSGGARLTAHRTHQLQRRYYHAAGIVRWIGSHARVTQYNPEPRVKHRWQAAVHFWNGVKVSTYATLHPKPVNVSPAVDSCLSELISRESGWNVRATNPFSGAYGLPQALPGSKMASAGADWATNPATQIRWMLGYVTMYGGSCGALAFQKAHGWY